MIKLFFKAFCLVLFLFTALEAKEKKAKKLKGLIFIEDVSLIEKDPDNQPRGITILKMKIPNAEVFKKKMKEFLGREMNRELLNNIKSEVTSYYKGKNFPLVRVTIPVNQNVSTGKVHVLILTSKIGKFSILGKRFSSDKKLKKEVSVSEGDDLTTEKLLEDVTWLENDPFRTVDIIYEEGEKLGTTNVYLNVQEKFPVRVYGGYEYSVYKTAGPARYKTGINLGHLFWTDQQLNAEFGSAAETSRWWSLSGNYVLPLPWRDNFKLFCSYVRSRPAPSEIKMDPDSNFLGTFWQIGARYDLRLKKIGTYRHQCQFGYDFKRSNNFIDYLGLEVSNNFVDISQFILRYEGAFAFQNSTGSFGSSLYFSPGYMSVYNTKKMYHLQRERSHPTYYYAIFNFDHFLRLKNNYMWVFNSLLHLTSSRLLASEQISLGGHLTVRGYKESAVVADRGLLIKNEIRTPYIPFTQKMKGVLQLLVFVDMGFLNDVSKYVLSKFSTFMVSVGPGFRYKISEYVDVRFDYGFQLRRLQGEINEKHLDSHGHFGAYLTF